MVGTESCALCFTVPLGVAALHLEGCDAPLFLASPSQSRVNEFDFSSRSAPSPRLCSGCLGWLPVADIASRLNGCPGPPTARVATKARR